MGASRRERARGVCVGVLRVQCRSLNLTDKAEKVEGGLECFRILRFFAIVELVQHLAGDAVHHRPNVAVIKPSREPPVLVHETPADDKR